MSTIDNLVTRFCSNLSSATAGMKASDQARLMLALSQATCNMANTRLAPPTDAEVQATQILTALHEDKHIFFPALLAVHSISNIIGPANGAEDAARILLDMIRNGELLANTQHPDEERPAARALLARLGQDIETALAAIDAALQ